MAITAAQGPFDDSSFAFQQYRDYSGTVFTDPAPLLATTDGEFLLTRPGKFDANVNAWTGRAVKLRGALIQSGRDRMLEIEPGSVHPSSADAQAQVPIENIGTVDLSGEIADGKCYFGVMNPGRGKVHRDCAVRCLSGGAPPTFLVRDAAGALHGLRLTGMGREILNYVAEPVRIRGELQRAGSQLILKADASSLRRE
ncbi:MAG: hypothetical protein ABI972_10165 [Acidobacteriota bacterium]